MKAWPGFRPQRRPADSVSAATRQLPLNVDIATHVDPRAVLRGIEQSLKRQGYTTRLIFPDSADPLSRPA